MILVVCPRCRHVCNTYDIKTDMAQRISAVIGECPSCRESVIATVGIFTPRGEDTEIVGTIQRRVPI